MTTGGGEDFTELATAQQVLDVGTIIAETTNLPSCGAWLEAHRAVWAGWPTYTLAHRGIDLPWLARVTTQVPPGALERWFGRLLTRPQPLAAVERNRLERLFYELSSEIADCRIRHRRAYVAALDH